MRAAILALAAAVLVTSGVAHADDAEGHFKHGVSLYQERDFKAALVEFRRAYELSSSWRLLYNVAQAEYELHDYASALATFDRYLREGADKIPSTRRAEVEQEIGRLRSRLGKVTIQSNVAGASVTVDGTEAGVTPVTHDVAIGEHRIAVMKDGYASWSKAVSIASGDTLTIDATLEPVPVAPPPVVAPLPVITVDRPPPPPEPHRFPWEPWAVTGVLTAGAVVTGILALAGASDLDAAKGRFDVTDRELDDASSRAKTFAVVTDVIAVTAIAAGAVAVYFTLHARSSRPREAGTRAVWRF